MSEQVKDVYTWRVLYQDGTTTDEFDEARPDGRGWAEREDKPVQTITLARVKDGMVVQSIDVPEGTEPVFFRRRIVTFDPTGSNPQHDTLAHCIGWKRGDEAEYLFVFDDGRTLLTDDLQAV